MPAVQIGAITAKGSDLYTLSLQLDGDRSVLYTGGQRAAAKQSHRLFRPGRGCNVPIVRLCPPQQIPQAATHQIGAVSALPQPRKHLRCMSISHTLSSGNWFFGYGCTFSLYVL